MDKLQLKETILSKIEKPHIPNQEFSVLQFGAVPNGEEIQTKVLQNAIDTVSAQGGGRLSVPAGRYRTGALQLKSGVELHLQSKDTILAFVSENPELYYPIVFSHWEATPCYNFSALIYAYDSHDIALTGEGILDGGADDNHWWNWHHQVEQSWSEDKPDLQLEDRKALRQMNQNGIAVEQRVFGSGHYLRPNFVQPIRCNRVLLQGFTLVKSPMWQLNPVMCKSLIVDGVTMKSHGANNDGCDPESCSGVWICNCTFDTGDDCISLKSGRDRDGRMANIPCEYVLIEKNEFADGHGGIALGSEMSGGIRYVLAQNNRFSSPNLTYALRLKTNARRGGKVEDIILADSVMDNVHGAAVHGTMLYEDGRNGENLPVFRNITIENIVAHGGDYGIFLEAFDEVPITGLVLRNIKIDGATRSIRSMNWEKPVIEQVLINGKNYPRPENVRILGVPQRGATLNAIAQMGGEDTSCHFLWQSSKDAKIWNLVGEGESMVIPSDTEALYLRVIAIDKFENTEVSHVYRIIIENQDSFPEDYEWKRLLCRGMLGQKEQISPETIISRKKLAEMMIPMMGIEVINKEDALEIAVSHGLLARDAKKGFLPDGYVTRQEMATVAMQACGVNYRNASSTMPVCADVDKVSNNYGTNVARALYFKFMNLNSEGCFEPERFVTMKEAVKILNRVADFAGI